MNTQSQVDPETTATPSDAELEKEHSGVDRRTVAKAGAWAVPVIAMSVAVPMAAASEPEPAGNTELDLMRFTGEIPAWSTKPGNASASISVMVLWEKSLPTAVITITASVAGTSDLTGPHVVVSGSGHTPTWNLNLNGVPSGKQKLLVTATADGFETIKSEVEINVI